MLHGQPQCCHLSHCTHTRSKFEKKIYGESGGDGRSATRKNIQCADKIAHVLLNKIRQTRIELTLDLTIKVGSLNIRRQCCYDRKRRERLDGGEGGLSSSRNLG